MTTRSHCVSGVCNRSRWRGGYLPWLVVALSLGLFFFPYLLPASSGLIADGYTALSSIPVAIGAFLLARRGALITWLILVVGLTLHIILVYGFSWPKGFFSGWLMGCIGCAAFALVAGYLRTMSDRLATAKGTIERLAFIDHLTGFPNHRAITDRVEALLEGVRLHGDSFALIFFDCDHFKRINDTYGHTIGDTVLRLLGQRASSVLREEDMVGRYGGEEFVVILPGASTCKALQVAEDMLRAVEREPLLVVENKEPIYCTISIGLSCAPEDGTTAEELLRKADDAMYWAKRLGRNRIFTVEQARHMQYAESMLKLQMEQEVNRTVVARKNKKALVMRFSERTHLIDTMLRMIERRDSEMSPHAHATSEMAIAIALEMGMDEAQIARIAAAALLHDIGKIALPAPLLQKSEILSTSEWILLKQHAELGAQMLEISPFLRALAPAVRYHHERWDGTGYPEGLAQEQIPLEARIIAVAEAYTVMRAQQPYQRELTSSEALEELQRNAGTQFDPLVVRTLTRALRGNNIEKDFLTTIR